MDVVPPPPATLGAPKSLRPRVVLTIGKLDGVHSGHRHLAAHVQELADVLGARSAAIVLHPDPASVLAGRRVPILTTVDERRRRLRAFGIEIVEPLRFTREVASLSADAFLGRLEERFDVAGVVIGPDFAFGQQREGNVTRLYEMAREREFDVRVVSPLESAGEWISSRRLRSLIQRGEIELARTLMRHPPRVIGTVVHGAARGRDLGFPTANLDLAFDFALPADGIYTVRASWRERRRSPLTHAEGVASVGVRPTFDDGARLVEVHLFDFGGDLYGKRLTVDFLSYQRPEQRFASVEGLVAQINQDVANARHFLELEARSGWRRERGGPVVARGRDRADLLQAVADAVISARSPIDGQSGAADATSHLARRVVDLRCPSDEDLLRAWLELLCGPGMAGEKSAGAIAGSSDDIEIATGAEGSGVAGEISRAEVYHTSPGGLLALVWTAPTRAARSSGEHPTIEAGPPALDTLADGWLQATFDLVPPPESGPAV